MLLVFPLPCRRWPSHHILKPTHSTTHPHAVVSSLGRRSCNTSHRHEGWCLLPLPECSTMRSRWQLCVACTASTPFCRGHTSQSWSWHRSVADSLSTVISMRCCARTFSPHCQTHWLVVDIHASVSLVVLISDWPGAGPARALNAGGRRRCRTLLKPGREWHVLHPGTGTLHKQQQEQHVRACLGEGGHPAPTSTCRAACKRSSMDSSR